MEGVAEAEAARSEREAHYAQHEQLYLDCAVGLRSALFATPTHSLTAAQALLERLQQDTSGDAAARAARADESLLEALPRCLAQASY